MALTTHVALLRAVNVGGTGKLPMSDLKDICEELGFGAVRTYIASGNVVFTSRKPEAAVKAALEKRLEAHAGKPVGVLVRAVRGGRAPLRLLPALVLHERGGAKHTAAAEAILRGEADLPWL